MAASDGLGELPCDRDLCAILLYFSVPSAWSSWEYKETSFSAWNPPVWPIKAFVPLALALMMLQAIIEFLRVVYEPAVASSEEGGAA